MAREYHVYFECEWGTGWRVLDNPEFADKGQRVLRGFARRAKRTNKIMEMADNTKLNPDDRLRYHSNRLILSRIEDVTSRSAAKQVDDLLKSTHNYGVDEQQTQVGLIRNMWRNKI